MCHDPNVIMHAPLLRTCYTRELEEHNFLIITFCYMVIKYSSATYITKYGVVVNLKF